MWASKGIGRIFEEADWQNILYYYVMMYSFGTQMHKKHSTYIWDYKLKTLFMTTTWRSQPLTFLLWAHTDSAWAHLRDPESSHDPIWWFILCVCGCVNFFSHKLSKQTQKTYFEHWLNEEEEKRIPLTSGRWVWLSLQIQKVPIVPMRSFCFLLEWPSSTCSSVARSLQTQMSADSASDEVLHMAWEHR